MDYSQTRCPGSGQLRHTSGKRGGMQEASTADQRMSSPSVRGRSQRRMDVVHLEFGKLTEPPLCSPGEVLAVIWEDERPSGQIYGRTDPFGRLDLKALQSASSLVHRPADLARASCQARIPQTVSVVICTRDRADSLARTLSSLRDQTRKPEQIVVVDNASRDPNTRVVTLAEGVDYVREDRPGLDVARNTGARKSVGEVVAYTDDDVVLHPRWLEHLVAGFDSPNVLAVTGLVLPAELETDAQILFEQQWGFGRGFRRIDFDDQYFARHRHYGCPVWEIGTGASMAFRRDAFTKVGYFDERLDDSEYWYRLLAAGWTCRYEPSAVAFHFHPETKMLWRARSLRICAPTWLP